MRSIKPIIKDKLPLVTFLYRKLRYSHFFQQTPEKMFTEIFHKNTWGDELTRSGPGSNLGQTEVIRKALPLIIQDLKCKSILDIPCGDFFWMKLVDMDIEYIGGDIVDELILNNQKQFSSDTRRFIKLDIIQDELPNVDLVFCRDCFVHLSDQDIYKSLKNIKVSKSKYLLMTTFIDRKKNENIPTGLWRPINFAQPPFSFPAPIKLINEECEFHDYRDKHLALWKVPDIPEFD